MGYASKLSRLSTVIFLGSQAFFTIPVFAAGYQINEISPSLQGSATAGAAAANNDVSSLFTNPATLSTLTENQVYLGGNEIIPSVSISNESATHTVNIPGIPPSSITAPVSGRTSQNNISTRAFVPDGYFGWRINDKFVAGLALVAPSGLTTKYYRDSVVRFDALQSEVETINITPSLSYTINNKWAVGAGFQMQYLAATFSNFDGPYTGTTADALIAATNPTYLKGNSWGFGYTAGVLFTPDVYTRLGAGYRSQVSEQISGHGQQYTSPGGIVPAPSHNFLFNGNTGVFTGIKNTACFNIECGPRY